ncbi:MAG TPA: hypothetical protein VIF62_38750, partial [Labilithrix sp.]
MRRTCWLLGVGIASVLAVACGSSDTTSGGRFTPGEDDIVSGKKDGGTDDCEAGVCSPAPQGGPDNGGGTPPPEDGGAPVASGACKTINACANATDLGSVSGDTGADVRSHQGTGGEFFTIRVTEDDHSAFGKALTAAITLVSPSRENYDLYVYDTDCSKPSEQSTQGTGTTDAVNLSWGEGYVANDGDDSKTIRIEVRPTSTTCGTDKWSLVI